MLDIKHLSKTFFPGTVNEKKALTDVNLHMEPGDFITIIGGNGAGKSTLLNSIAGVFPIDGGQILIDGVDVSKMPEHKRARYIGRVFQDPMMGTAAGMMIEENLAIASRRGKTPGLSWALKDSDRERFREMLKELDLGLEDRLTSRVGLLSGGQRQALTLLMAAMNQPRILLLDEHTAALDPKTAEKVLNMTQKVIARDHLTSLMITHNMRDALRFGNRLIMMNAGRIVVDVNAEEKAKLTIPDLLALFEKASGSALDNDRMMLS
ncbi:MULTISPECIES: ABC transporter ATP-binding protein [Acidaminococcus]|jgi:putative ABC transport system ATP-binding protein|uniref:ABC transporter ATP-binding protein n=1 Tax=Acidaminococcus fermentans TaxID=905 RepID=A0A6N7VN32_ACIFE|nr:MULTISPECIES: ABC transporter ATP-binding protein [Acidaminococcus]MEE1599064.1 ABC transporter ATP-binding protein [Acidaminococcus fermentans]MEE4123326.1 ABC transporter ATP-binding protein [Acidaminococcus fermentans]MSS83087.1 ABC transporter ATP-binding protein [Acidaminococcus fermentans]CDE94414.1 aBC transporter related protein [Acidaminococcus sp. CAG:542]